MNIQITWTNPFLRGPFSADGQKSFFERLTGEGGHFLRYKRKGPADFAEGETKLVASLLASTHAVHLGVAGDSEGGIVAVLRLGHEVVSVVPTAIMVSPELTWEQILELPEIKDTLAQMSRSARSGRRRWLAMTALLTAGLALVMGVYVLTRPADQQLVSAPVLAPAPTTEGASSNSDLLSATERSVLAGIVAKGGIALDPRVQGKPFVVFSDPNCPACRQLEIQLASVSKDKFTPIVVPVAFKEGSQPKVTGIFCAKDVATAWSQAVGTDESAAPSCTKGDAQAQSNNAAFIALRFSSTPTIVAPNGRVISGVGTSEQLTRWLSENS